MEKDNLLILCVILIFCVVAVCGIVLTQNNTNSSTNTTNATVNTTNNTTNINNTTTAVSTNTKSATTHTSNQVSSNSKSGSSSSDSSLEDGPVLGDEYEGPGYTVYGDDGGFRQYDDQGNLRGSTYDEDQQYLANQYGY